MGSTEGDGDAGAMSGTGRAGCAGVAGVGEGLFEGDGNAGDAGAIRNENNSKKDRGRERKQV